ncbi:uncharacterized protein LOC101449861 [Ceratitis capitata]|uniref:uncharacterized protein LOC101449861 n=1 Tax=Ceratitis capitata TaxID=7213 RepID=UPI0003299940|nr:uncharacterized protein LOC101449861 [Ceratitis capitata]
MSRNSNSSNEFGNFQTGKNNSNIDNDSTTNVATYDKSQSLVDIANNTFKELCRTLEKEQSKLMELEERRKKLQEEMLRLKQEIEEEKHSYRLNLVESLTENAEAMSTRSKEDFENDNMEKDEDSGSEFKSKLYTCYEDDEVAIGEGATHVSYLVEEEESKHPNDIALSIQKKLQGVVAECVIEQCNYVDPDKEVGTLNKTSP